MAENELVVIDRTYELTKWFLGHLARFPRAHRYGLGQRIEEKLYQVLEGLIHAKYGEGAGKIETLRTVNLELEVLRINCRLAHEMNMIPHKSHEYAVRELIEIGKMVGGWLKQQQRRA